MIKTIDADVLEALATLANSYGKKLDVTIECMAPIGKVEMKIAIGEHFYTSASISNGTFVAALSSLSRGLALEQKDEATT